MQFLNKSLTSIFLVALVSGGGSSALAKISNLAEVEPGIWRGQIPTRADLKELKGKGVKTVIDLQDEERHTWREEKDAKSLDLKYFNIPMRRSKAVDMEAFKKFLIIASDPANKPLYVHCHGGQDRTGVMLALYRVEVDGWSHDKAYDEMLKHGYHRMFYRLKRSLYEYKPTATAVKDGASVADVTK